MQISQFNNVFNEIHHAIAKKTL